jgi:uncharacterized phiE125 gp8 family phage protein
MQEQSQQYGLKLITAATEEPVTLGEMRSRLRMSAVADDTELVNIWVPAARTLIEKEIGVRFLTQTWQLSLDRFRVDLDDESDGVRYFEIPIRPVTAVSWVKYYDTDNTQQTLSTSYYDVDMARDVCRIALKQGYSWPSVRAGKPGAVTVQFVVGYASRAALPQTLRAAIMLQAEAMFDGEEALLPTVERLLAIEWSGSLDAKT